MMPETSGKFNQISRQQAKLKRWATEFQQGEEGKALNQLKSSCQGKAYGAYSIQV
ncbi:hypothetical protein NNC51_14080 [Prevotella copri]|jgi:hypothetical protein|uniref:Uncharacterized protein n=1 Tax=Segatella copri TaxID=165179 RepID=A0AAW5IZV6_9BACT|nr:hypothetical protein [Segatella copri]MCP9553916.1 hypothetical protein [Segatella copri]MCP9574665.1 hypothetical protein [Segatella copri]MCP9577627.1 hypothetical protein [Segatella copri]MCP9580543.1 hypothetical protein [Segatella copri]MCP9583464.1 hypothetical protein [Segatella copri]